jgi:formate/nitrite transporter FocA (FNT family)
MVMVSLFIVYLLSFMTGCFLAISGICLTCYTKDKRSISNYIILIISAITFISGLLIIVTTLLAILGAL